MMRAGVICRHDEGRQDKGMLSGKVVHAFSHRLHMCTHSLVLYPLVELKA